MPSGFRYRRASDFQLRWLLTLVPTLVRVGVDRTGVCGFGGRCTTTLPPRYAGSALRRFRPRIRFGQPTRKSQAWLARVPPVTPKEPSATLLEPRVGLKDPRLALGRATLGSIPSERGSFSLTPGTQQSRAWLSAIGAWVFSGHAWVFWIGGWLFLGGTTLSSIPITDGRADRQHSRARKHAPRLRRSAFLTYTRGVGGGWRARYAAAPAKRVGVPDITSKEWT
jgi:hypothetical protein